MQSRHISLVINATPEAVYEYAANPANLTSWASGLATGKVRRQGHDLVVEGPLGTATVAFAPTNTLGVLDHDVALPSGQVVHNPVRVVAHPHGAEVIFTIRQLDLDDHEFDRDTLVVERDLDALKKAVES